MQILLIFRQPEQISAGGVVDLMVGQVDFMSTILDYIGLGDIKIANSPGKSFAASFQGE